MAYSVSALTRAFSASLVQYLSISPLASSAVYCLQPKNFKLLTRAFIAESRSTSVRCSDYIKRQSASKCMSGVVVVVGRLVQVEARA